MLPNEAEFKILDLKNRETGTLNVQILPCNLQGKPLTDKDAIAVRNPATDLINKNLSFLVKINSIKLNNPRFEVRENSLTK